MVIVFDMVNTPMELDFLSNIWIWQDWCIFPNVPPLFLGLFILWVMAFTVEIEFGDNLIQ